MCSTSRCDYGDDVRRPSRCLFAVLGVAVFGSSAAGCGDESSGSSAGEVTVFAAASLTGAFSEIGDAFEAANPGTSVTFNFAASSSLVQAIGEGAPAHVFASADTANMQKLIDAGNARGGPRTFATNELQIITGAGNPAGIAAVEDLADPDLIVVACGEEVPIGRYTAEVFRNAAVTVTPKSYEADVKAVVNKVILGEADAGIVYATDVQAAGDDASGVEIPDELNVTAAYPIAVTTAAGDVETAEAFVGFVLSEAGQQILAAAGFGGP
jgi:molybdate transport system substrate-binding protein